MLDSHPEIAIPHETYYVVRLAGNRRRYGSGAGFATESFLDDLFATGGFGRMDLSQDVVRAAFSSRPPSSYPDAIRRVFKLYALERGKTRYGDKTPVYVLHIGLLGSLFPEARFVHIIRDGRDVTRSFLDGGWADRIEDAALYWRLQVTRGRKAGRRLGPDRYHEVRYEDLVAEPGATLETICAFLGMAFDPAMLRYQESARRWAAASSRPERHRNILHVPTEGVRDWRREVSQHDLAIVEHLTGGLLADLGYELSAGASSLNVRVDGGRRWAGWQGRRIGGHLRGLVHAAGS